jgi:hypothetical protein
MRGFIYILAALLICSALGVSRSSDCASIRRDGDEVTLTAESWHPVMAVGRALADGFGVSVSVEDPKWAFPLDTEDVAVDDPKFSAEHHNVHYLLMKRHVLQVRFSAPRNAAPKDIPELLRQLADAANQEMPYAYRVDASDNHYALVPTKTRNSAGQVEDVQPLLDRHVTIPPGTRAIAEHAELMAEQLSQQTGLHVSCCQAFAGGILWGRTRVTFAAQDKSAREVLTELIRLEDEANSESPNKHPAYDHWTVGCDGTGAPWCFIEVEGKYGGHCRLE